MPHFDEIPPPSADDRGPMLSSPSRPPFDLPRHVRHSQEKVNGNARTSSHTSIKGSLNEEPASHMEGANGVRLVNGDTFQDTNLNSLPNGRSSASSWDLKSSPSRNGSALSINGGSNGLAENGRRSPALQSGLNRHSNGDRISGSAASASTHTVVQNSEAAPLRSAPTTNGDSEPTKTIAIPPPISTNPQSTGPLTYQSSLLPATPLLSETPMHVATRAVTGSPHRFSSPPSYPSPLAASPSTHSLPQGAPESLRHRHTLQVPKQGAGRNSRDGEEGAVFSSGRFSPTGIAAGVRRGSLSLNRRHTQSIHSNMPHDEIVPDEDAMLWADKLREKRASKRKRKEEEDDDRVIVGTKVDEQHVNWVTAYNMLTGIRFTVSRTNAKLDRPLTDADFDASHKFSFDITGNELTPSARYDFKFKDYAPWVFRHLRAHFKLDPADYLMSLTSKYILSELGSPGKSGSFFYFSRDYKYIIKTIHHAEHKFLRKILRQYYKHIEDNPNTLLSQFYGLHRVKMPYGRKIHFVIMNNLFPPHRDIHQTFDLKGSTIGRDFKEEDLEKNPRATLKDQNWNRRNLHLEFGPAKRQVFIDQMEKDVCLLQNLQIMDYSMLVGIHDLQKGNQENIRDQTLQVFNPGGDHFADDLSQGSDGRGSLMRTQSSMESARKARELRDKLKAGKPIPMGLSSNRMPDQMEENVIKREFTFYSDDGGFRATHQDDSPADEIFYLSIIDCLTHYGTIKKLEHFWKGYLKGENRYEISPIRPEPYGERFLNYISKVTKSPEEAAAEVVPNSQSRTNSNKLSILQREKHDVKRSERMGEGREETESRTLSTMRSPSPDRGGVLSGQTLPVVEELGEASSTGGRSERSRERDNRPVTPSKDGLYDRPLTPAKDHSPHLNGNGVNKAVSRTSLDKELPPLPRMASPEEMEPWR